MEVSYMVTDRLEVRLDPERRRKLSELAQSMEHPRRRWYAR
jgi:predicted transcriptional regulator